MSPAGRSVEPLLTDCFSGFATGATKRMATAVRSPKAEITCVATVLMMMNDDYDDGGGDHVRRYCNDDDDE